MINKFGKEDIFTELLKEIKNLEIEEQRITFDIYPGRGEEKWLNLILWKK